MLALFVRFQSIVESIPEEVLERLPDDVVQQLEDGVIDKIPQDLVDKLPEGLRDSIPSGLIEAAGSNPLFAVIGVLGIIGFGYGVVKSAFKAAMFFGVLAAVAWFFFLN
jgi:hypothetical protein